MHFIQSLRPFNVLTALRVMVILGACGWAYAPSFHGDWLWDDDLLLTQNPDVASEKGILGIWLNPATPDYFPLTQTLFWIQWRIFGLNPDGYRAVALSLHTASALLIWHVVGRLRISGGWLAGLLFAVHPVCVASVVWISELKNTLSLPLFLLACASFIRWQDKGESRSGTLALAFFLMAMLSKSSVVMFPVAGLIFVWWRKGRLERRDILRLSPFFGVSLLLGLVTVHFQHQHAMGSENSPLGGPLQRMAVTGPAVLHYLQTILLAKPLMAIYPQWSIDPIRMSLLAPWGALLLAGLVCWRQRRSWGRHALFGFGFFLVMVSPVLGAISMSFMRISWVSDHFIYVPLVGPLVMTSAAVSAGWNSIARLPRVMATMASVGTTVFLMHSTRQHASVWKNEENLWSHNLRLNPDAWQAHNRLGAIFFNRRDFERAHAHFREALRVRPDLPEILNNLASIHMAFGRPEQAIPLLLKAARISPGDTMVRDNLIKSYLTIGEAANGAVHARILTETNPRDPVGYNNLGIMLRAENRVPASRRAFHAALQVNPAFDEARKSLALLNQEERSNNPAGIRSIPSRSKP